MNAVTLILIAPASLLLGAALQILAARLFSARTKGILAFLACLPAVACRGPDGALGPGRPGNRTEPLPLGRSAGPRLPRRRAQRPLCLDGYRPRRLRPALLHRLHGPRQVRHPLLCLDAGLHRRLRRTGLQRQPLLLLSLLGTGRPLLLQPGRLLVHQPRGRRRRAQSPADDPHRGLRPAGGDSGDLPPHRQRSLDRSSRGSCLHRRRLCADAGGAGCQVRASSPAHLDSRGHGRAHTGQRPAARSLLCEGRRLSCLPHAQLRRMARDRWLRLGQRNSGLDRHRHHGRRRDVRHGADRPEAHAGLLHRQPDRLHDDGHRHRHAAGHRRRACSIASITDSSRAACSSPPARCSTPPAPAT